MFTFKRFSDTDFPVEAGQLKSNIAFGSSTAIKHSKTSEGPDTLGWPPLSSLPFAKKKNNSYEVLGILVFKSYTQLCIYIKYV